MPLHQRLIGFGARPQDFTPDEIAGLSLWLDASQIAGLSDGDPVTTWADASGNGYDVTQGTTANKPVYKTGIMNGRAVVRFDGSNDFLANTADDPVGAGGARTVFMVGEMVNLSGATILCFRRSTLIYNQSIVLFSGQYYIYTDGVNASSNATIPNPSAAVTNPFQIMLRSTGSGNKITCRINQADRTVTQSGSVSAESGAAGFSVGYRADIPGNYYNGDMAEIIVYDSALSSSDRNRVEAYLKTRYGLP